MTLTVSTANRDDVGGNNNIAIRVQNLSKCYQIYDNPRDWLKQFVVHKLCRAIPPLRKVFPTNHSPAPRFALPTYYREFWALKDVSFEIKKGETVGIIGRNGSGNLPCCKSSAERCRHLQQARRIK